MAEGVAKLPPTAMSTPSTAPPPASLAHVFTAEDMDAPRAVSLPGGTAWVYSRRCPERSDNQDAAALFAVETGGSFSPCGTSKGAWAPVALASSTA